VTVLAIKMRHLELGRYMYKIDDSNVSQPGA